MRLFRELQRRGVLKVAIGYLGVSWLTLEIGHTLFLIFELPHAGLQAIFALLVLGFPLAVFATWQGWLGDALAQGAGAGTAGSAIAPEHAAHGQAAGHHEGHESAWHAAVFGLLVVLVIAIAIGIRFFGMEGGHGGNEHAAAAHGATAPAEAPAAAAAAAFTPPPHSVAVLPFVNMSGDPGQDYFSDGLSEELLNSLANIPALHVAARTSSFSFKGATVDTKEIAHRLNVGALLEGSVRREGTHVRITAQLIDSASGFHLWSKTYDRDLHGILALQAEIAKAVTLALQASLTDSATAAIELGGTQVPDAFDAYLRGEKYPFRTHDPLATAPQIAAFSEAIRRDPRYAKAYVGRAFALASAAESGKVSGDRQRMFAEARDDAQKALALAPGLGQAHSALAYTLSGGFHEFARALQEHEQALLLAPGDARVPEVAALFMSFIGREEAAVSNAQRAVLLDPVNPSVHRDAARAYFFAGHYRESITEAERAFVLDPNLDSTRGVEGRAYLVLGDFPAAVRTCESGPMNWNNFTCLAVAQHKLGNERAAQEALDTLRQDSGDSAAYQYSLIYAQWGNLPLALDWLEKAHRLSDPGILWMRSDRLMDPIRNQPRFAAIEQALDLPN